MKDPIKNAIDAEAHITGSDLAKMPVEQAKKVVKLKKHVQELRAIQETDLESLKRDICPIDKEYDAHCYREAVAEIGRLNQVLSDIEELAREDADYCADTGSNTSMKILGRIDELRVLKR